MATLTVRLFGRLTVQRDGNVISGLHAGKLQELFCYLLLKRSGIHSREALASLLWGECDTALSKKYLRQALWHLQSALNCNPQNRETRLLRVDPNSAGIDPNSDLWLDVEIFEKASVDIHDVHRSQLDEQQAKSLAEAVQLYQGDLLEGWYQDWCLFERERLQNLYFSMLDRLICFCEVRGLYQSGLDYGERILRIDRAHERTHQRMLRLLYLAGDRAGALRQYQRCLAALAEELGVRPAMHTVELYEQICGDHLEDSASTSKGISAVSPDAASQGSQGPQILTRLRRIQAALCGAQLQVQHEIDLLEQSVHRKPRSATPVSRRAV